MYIYSFVYTQSTLALGSEKHVSRDNKGCGSIDESRGTLLDRVVRSTGMSIVVFPVSSLIVAIFKVMKHGVMASHMLKSMSM